MARTSRLGGYRFFRVSVVIHFRHLLTSKRRQGVRESAALFATVIPRPSQRKNVACEA